MTLSSRTLWIIGVIVATVIGLIAVVSSGADYPWQLYVGHFPDLASDKYTALAAIDGSGPYATLAELASRYGFAEAGYAAPHPRTPAGLLTQLPLVLIPDRWLVLTGVPMMVAAVALLLWASTRIADIDSRWGVLALFLWVGSPLFSWDILYPTAGFVSWLVVVGWWLVRNRRLWAGVVFGAAAAIKLWPGMIILALLARRDTRQMGWIAALAGASLTLGGLLLPGTSIDGTVTALRAAGAYFGRSEGNLSAIHAFGWPAAVVAVALFGWGITRRALDWRIAAAIGAGLLLSPLVWGNYYYALFPVATVGLAALLRTTNEPTRSGA